MDRQHSRATRLIRQSTFEREGGQLLEEFGMLDLRDEWVKGARPAASPQWTLESAWATYRLSFNDLLFRAHSVHRQHFDPNRVQLSRLLNIKSGGCPEDCGYCNQSAHHSTG